MRATRLLAEAQNCQSESEIRSEEPGYCNVNVSWNRNAVRLQLLPGAQALLRVFLCGFEIPFQFLNQLFQRKGGNSVERLPVRDFQSLLRRLRAKPAGQPLVIIIPRVVF